MATSPTCSRRTILTGLAWLTAIQHSPWIALGQSEPSTSPSSSGPPRDYDPPRSYTDRLDRTTQFQRPPNRIISLSPESTELLFAIGAGDRFVGATEYCNYPEQAKKLPRVGLGTVESISREKILSLRPDLVICRWDTHARLIPTLERVGIAALAVGPQSVEQLCQEASKLGEVLDVADRANQFARDLQDRIAALQAKIPGSAPSDRPAAGQKPTLSKQSVYYELWNSPPMTAGPSSFIGELLQLANLRNIFEDVKLPSPQINFESVIARNPDVILIPDEGSGKDRIAEIQKRPGWQSINAVKQGRIYLLSGDKISRCGPRLVESYQEILEKIHPEVDFNAGAPKRSSPSQVQP